MGNNFPGKDIPLTDRTVMRSSGCYNCRHFSRGELVRKRLHECRQRDMANKIAELGYIPTLSRLGDLESTTNPGDARYEKWEHAAAMGEIGLCMKGMAEADFCHQLFLCEGWTGAEGASVAREGQKPDLLPEELIEEVENKAKDPVSK